MPLRCGESFHLKTVSVVLPDSSDPLRLCGRRAAGCVLRPFGAVARYRRHHKPRRDASVGWAERTVHADLLSIARAARSSSDLGHCGSLPCHDSVPGPPGPDDGCGVAQLDERVLAVEVAECLRVYSGADSAVQMLGRGEQVLCLEHASPVADPPPLRPAGEAEAAADGEILSVLKGVSDICDGRGLVRLVAGQREACGLAAELVKRRGKGIPRVGDIGG